MFKCIKRNKGCLFVLLVSWLAFVSCKTSKHDDKSVEAAMQYYNHLILHLDADSIAQLYTPDGNMGNIAIGRDSIRHFLAGFKNVRVLSQTSQTTSIQIDRDTAVQKGTYQQKDLVNNKDTVAVKGEFTTRWQWIADFGWRIKKMETKSLQ